MEIKVWRGKEMLIHDGMQMIKSQEGAGFCKGSVMFICSLEKRSQQTNEKNDFWQQLCRKFKTDYNAVNECHDIALLLEKTPWGKKNKNQHSWVLVHARERPPQPHKHNLEPQAPYCHAGKM